MQALEWAKETSNRNILETLETKKYPTRRILQYRPAQAQAKGVEQMMNPKRTKILR